MASKPTSLEEGMASLILSTDDRTVTEAASGAHGEQVRLLSLGEKVRRDRRSKPRDAA